MTVKTVVFDLGGVLIRWDPQSFVDEMFAHEPESERPYWLVEMAKDKSGTWAKLDAGIIDRTQALDELKTKYDPVILNKFFENLPACLTPIERGVEILKKVAPHYKCLALTNYHEDLFKEVQGKNSFFSLFSGEVVSARVHCCKPNPGIYNSLLETFDIHAEECVFIDDGLANVLSARELGFKAIHCTDFDQVEAELQSLGVLLGEPQPSTL